MTETQAWFLVVEVGIIALGAAIRNGTRSLMTDDPTVELDSIPWVELSPGALGRLALFADPHEVAQALTIWGPTDAARIGVWFVVVGFALDDPAATWRP